MLNNVEQAYALITDYTKKVGRPGISDLMTLDILIDMNETDGDEYLWLTTPDEVLQHMVDNSELFTVEYGWEDMSEAIREYLLENNFIKSLDEVEEEEE